MFHVEGWRAGGRSYPPAGKSCNGVKGFPLIKLLHVSWTIRLTSPREPGALLPSSHRITRYLVGFTMGFRIMRLVTLWLVASAEAFRVHGTSATHGTKGVQGGAARGQESTKEVNKKGPGSHDVCSVGDSPAACRELTAKYRGGGEFISTFHLPVHCPLDGLIWSRFEPSYQNCSHITPRNRGKKRLRSSCLCVPRCSSCVPCSNWSMFLFSTWNTQTSDASCRTLKTLGVRHTPKS